jgi:ribA/ribD-fused uncharacterized protein
MGLLFYRKSEVAWFRTKKDPHWALSNMAGAMPVYWPPERTIANRWNSTEQLYQACKYSTTVRCLPESNPDADACVRNRIRLQVNPRGAKLTQKCAVNAGLVRPDWEREEIRLKAMLWVLELKAFWNRHTFGESLEATGDRVIVEISTKDDFWGCKEFPGGELHGENQLGRLLMEVRTRLPNLLRREFTCPEGFLLP